MQSLLDFFTKKHTKKGGVEDEVEAEPAVEEGQDKAAPDTAPVKGGKAIEEAGAADAARASMRLSQ